MAVPLKPNQTIGFQIIQTWVPLHLYTPNWGLQKNVRPLVKDHPPFYGLLFITFENKKNQPVCAATWVKRPLLAFQRISTHGYTPQHRHSQYK